MSVTVTLFKHLTFQLGRRQRMAELRAVQLNAKYGDVTDISKADWLREVNNAGEGVWVIVHVYKEG